MGLAVEAPAREDLYFLTNDDKRVGARWLGSDEVTPVVISSAKLTLAFEQAPQTYDDDGVPVPRPPAEVHEITSTTPGDVTGWFEPSLYPSGVVLATVPHGIWAGYEMRAGRWDLIAVSGGLWRCLVRGTFETEEGFS
jgi:hypothetical protein